MKRRMKAAVCGNGVLESGEDCDCGLNKSCVAVEACCNPRTCRFYPGAECLSGACCSGCKILPAGYSCRSSKDSCDLEEVCNGTSAQCPEDDRLVDGSPCPSHVGICLQGNCIDVQQQCVDLWGPGATIAHESCYSNFNPTGSMTGHCGYDSRLHKYIPCFEQDVKCGLLHCQGGLPYPLISSTNFMTFHVNTREGSFECKSISSPQNAVLVKDGTICGENRFCQNNICTEQDPKPNCHVEETCSGNGLCTKLGSCSCYLNWKGRNCSIFDYDHATRSSLNQSLPFGTDTTSPTIFAGIALMTCLMIITCVIVTCLFRTQRKREQNKRRKKTQESPTDQNLNLTENPTVFINPHELKNIDRAQISLSAVSTPMSLHRSRILGSNRSINSVCTGFSYVVGETPRSLRYSTSRKLSSNGIFSDSETPRTRSRRATRHIGSPYLLNQTTRQHGIYTTLKRPDMKVRYESAKKIYDDIDKLSTNENLRDFIEVLDSLAQEKFGGNKFQTNTTMASSPTETNESVTLDSGYQSTKQLMNADEYAVVIKNRKTQSKYSKRRRSFSSIDNQQHESQF